MSVNFRKKFFMVIHGVSDIYIEKIFMVIHGYSRIFALKNMFRVIHGYSGLGTLLEIFLRKSLVFRKIVVYLQLASE